MSPLNSAGYDTDKGKSYLQYYEAFFAPHRNRPLRLLELGIHRGGSLQMWRDYFPMSQIIGVDLSAPELPDYDRIRVYGGDASDPSLFDRIAAEIGGDRFDIIIDDASHLGIVSKRTFELLFMDRLNPGGLYVLEDWGTGYLAHWPDGAAMSVHADVPTGAEPAYELRSHQMGMVGLIKQLIDHIGSADVIAGGATAFNPYPIDYATVAPGLCFLKKKAIHG